MVTGVVTALGVLLREWLQRRDREHRGRRQLQVARERVDFIDAWVAAQERLAPDASTSGLRTVAEAELAEALRVAREAWVQAAPTEATVDLEGAIRTIFLARELAGLPAQALRLVYWCSLVWAAFWVAVGLDLTLEPDSGASDWILFVLMVVGFAVAPAWGLHAFTVRVDRGSSNIEGLPVVIDVRDSTRLHSDVAEPEVQRTTRGPQLYPGSPQVKRPDDARR
jgi:hypothetical protein